MNQATGTAMLPENVCSLCMRTQKDAGELLLHRVTYPYVSGQKRLCHECREKVSTAIARALKEIGWH
jgi:hypothetical protein